METQFLGKRIKFLLWLFITALVLSGITAFPLEWELGILYDAIGPGTFMAQIWPAMANWIAFVRQGLSQTYANYPFMAYGTDWLAFAHLVIAVAFWGPLKDPIKNVWVVEFGMIASLLVIPLALICGPLRGIPLFWQLIDCSFGLFGLIPLWLTRRDIQRLIAVGGETVFH